MDKFYSFYGYNINDSIEYRVTTGSITNIRNGRSHALNNTSRRLLEYLLSETSSHGWISDDDIAINIFEKNGLRYSSSALWRIMNALRLSFNHIGGDVDFIKRHNRHGYYVDNKRYKLLLVKA
ncbi:hypothetical protein AB4K05_14480 [Kluyvera sp. STS39-E]|uniref:hypothetical protein n=1 Tax=Kluyvera sp. STS39-E TaxID=3234748 RepID=UPI0034C64CB9